MEYIIGSLFTMLSLFVLNRALAKTMIRNESIGNIRYSQSHIYSLVADILDNVLEPPNIKTQSGAYLANTYTKVMILDNEAFWIKDNTLYTASMIDGEVDKDSVKEVDTMSMSKIQLEKTMFVVEKLREGLDDSGSSGKQKF